MGRFNPSSTSHPSLVSFISLLYNLLDDSNFKVVHGTLQVLHLLVILPWRAGATVLGTCYSSFCQSAGRQQVGDQTRKGMKIFLKLMKEVGPQQVLCLLLEHLKHTFQSERGEHLHLLPPDLSQEDFDLSKLSFDLASALVDSNAGYARQLLKPLLCWHRQWAQVKPASFSKLWILWSCRIMEMERWMLCRPDWLENPPKVNRTGICGICGTHSIICPG